MSQPTAQNYQNTRPVVLLDLSWAGRVWRLSTEPVDVQDRLGVWYSYEGGLDDVDLDDSLNLLETDTGESSASVQCYLPVNVAALRREGHDIQQAVGTLWMVSVRGSTVEQTIEGRWHMLTGKARNPQYGAPKEDAGWLAFTLSDEPWESTAKIIDPEARINTATWEPAGGELLPDESKGKPYPVIIGRPGRYDVGDGTTGNAAGSPAYVVKQTNVSKTAEKLLLAGHPGWMNSSLPAATLTVTIFDTDGNSEAFAAVVEQDDINRYVTTADVSSAVVIDLTLTEFWCSWVNVQGLPDPFSGSEGLTRGGHVCMWALGQSGLEVDLQRWATVIDALNAYKFAGYINDEDADYWGWLSDQVLPYLPLTIKRGPKGMYPIVWDREVYPANVVATVEAGADWYRDGAVTIETTPDDIINAVYIEHAIDGVSGEPLNLSKVMPTTNPLADTRFAEDGRSHISEISAARYGLKTELLTMDYMWDTPTADALAALRVRRKGLSIETVAYSAEWSWGWLQVGDWVQITDADLALTSEIVLISARSWDGAQWMYTVTLFEAPLTSARRVP